MVDTRDTSTRTNTDPPKLLQVHRDTCLRILHLNLPSHKGTWEQAYRMHHEWMESFLYARLIVSYSEAAQRRDVDGGGDKASTTTSPAQMQPQTKSLVFRDFVRLHQQLGPSLSPSSLVTAARNVLDNLKYKLVQDQDLKDFVEGSLGRLVKKTSSIIDYLHDWTRIWDFVGEKFVFPLAITDYPGQDETPTATVASVQAQRLAWTLTCIRAQQLQLKYGINDGDDDYLITKQRRRERVLAGCGVLAFLTALYESTVEEGENTEPSRTQKFRFDTIYMTLAEFIYKQSQNTGDQYKLTHFGTYSSAIPVFYPTITAVEIEKEVKNVAKMIWKYTAECGNLKPSEAGEEARSSPSSYRMIPWLRQLERIPFGGNKRQLDFVTVHQVVDRLAMTVGSLYEETLLAPPTPSEEGFVYDEATLIELDSLLPLEDGRQKRIAEKIISNNVGECRSGTHDVLPPILTEAMELKEWTLSLMNLEVVEPSQQLRQVLDVLGWKNMIVPILNRIVLRFTQEQLLNPTSPINVTEDGLVTLVAGGGGFSRGRHCRAVVAMYYHSLEAILYCEIRRLKASPDTNEKTHEILKSRVIRNSAFHAALMACCILCVNKAIGESRKIASLLQSPCLSVLSICDCQPQEFLKVSESFHRSLTGNTPARGQLGSPLTFPLPRILWKQVSRVEMNIMELYLWKQEPKSFAERIRELKAKRYWPPESLAPDSDDDDQEVAQANPTSADLVDYFDYRSLAYVFRRVLKLAYCRILALLDFLNVHPHRALLAHQVFVAMRYLLRHHIALLYDRHLDQMILCCIYGVCKTLKYSTPEVTFAKIIDAYVVVRGQEQGDITCQRVVRYIKMDYEVSYLDTKTGDVQPVGNIIQLYNGLFLPKMQDHFLMSKSLQRAAAKLARKQQQKQKQQDDAGLIHEGYGRLPVVDFSVPVPRKKARLEVQDNKQLQEEEGPKVTTATVVFGGSKAQDIATIATTTCTPAPTACTPPTPDESASNGEGVKRVS